MFHHDNAPTSTGVPVIEFQGRLFESADPGTPFLLIRCTLYNSFTGNWETYGRNLIPTVLHTFNIVLTENLTASSCAVDVDGPSSW